MVWYESFVQLFSNCLVFSLYSQSVFSGGGGEPSSSLPDMNLL